MEIQKGETKANSGKFSRTNSNLNFRDHKTRGTNVTKKKKVDRDRQSYAE